MRYLDRPSASLSLAQLRCQSAPSLRCVVLLLVFSSAALPTRHRSCRESSEAPRCSAPSHGACTSAAGAQKKKKRGTRRQHKGSRGAEEGEEKTAATGEHTAKEGEVTILTLT